MAVAGKRRFGVLAAYLVVLGPAFCHIKWQQVTTARRTCLHASSETAEALEIFGLESVPSFEELRRSFRRLAAKTHPDVSGSADSFRRVVDAYRHLQSVDPGTGKDAVDEFLKDWLEESPVPGWGDFGQIERDTDDDGMMQQPRVACRKAMW
ncbi:unnamed protein product [Durusdinium trenchii]|uniref:J domain-containing protein n=1 Tax=Durusdinium trenchii TaxID=1381693 RepID=A0ABP0SVN0_9DINO